MIRTQIQLPDATYARLKRLSTRLEVSLAEILRRGAEYMLRVHAAGAAADWELPEPLDLGAPLAPVEDWRLLANEPASTGD